MLTDIARRTNDFSFADIVVLEEDNLEKVANILICVYDSPNTVDEMNDCLCHPVSRSSFATENGHSWSKFLSLLRTHCLDCQPSVNDPEYVELLALILVYPLDLDVEKSRRVDCHTGGVLDVLSKSDFVGILNLL